MANDELCWLPASRLATLIRARKVSPVEVIDSVLDRIEIYSQGDLQRIAEMGSVAIERRQCAGNMQLQEGAVVLAVLAVPAPGGASFGPFRRTAVAADALSVNAVAAATATVPYTATIEATQVE